MSRVTIVTTGGTIASRLDLQTAAVLSSVEGGELLASLAALTPAGVECDVEPFCNLGSFAIDLATSFKLARRIDALLASPDLSGVVVTHGTDTMEEAAYLADLVVSSDKPVVFTGAQRPADAPDADGPRNLSDAIRVAASDQACGLGTMIVFDGDIHAARDVTKTHTTRVGTFASAEHGKLGDVDDDVRITRRPPRRTFPRTMRIEMHVDLIRLVIGADDRFVRHALQTGARGLVLEAFGRGNATPAIVGAVGDAVRAGIVVAIASRCPQGRVSPIYGGGGGVDLAAAGAVFAGDLAGVKARLLLSILLGSGLAHRDVKEIIARA